MAKSSIDSRRQNVSITGANRKQVKNRNKLSVIGKIHEQANSFEVAFFGLAAKFAITPICNILRAGGSQVTCLN